MSYNPSLPKGIFDFTNMPPMKEPGFRYAVGILLGHMHGDGHCVVRGLRAAGNTLLHEGDEKMPSVYFFGAYAQNTDATYNSILLEMHRVLSDPTDLFLTIGPVTTYFMEKIIAENRYKRKRPRSISLAGFSSVNLNDFDIGGFDPKECAQAVRAAYPDLKSIYMPHYNLPDDHYWMQSVLYPGAQALEENGIMVHTAPAYDYDSIVDQMPSSTTHLMILPHDALIEEHVRLHAELSKKNITLMICSQSATKRTSDFAYAPDMMMFGYLAGLDYIGRAILTPEGEKTPDASRIIMPYTVLRRQDSEEE